jgi:hypothetical protein
VRKSITTYQKKEELSMKKREVSPIVKKTVQCILLLGGLLAVTATASADEKCFLCAAAEAVVCPKDGECFRGPVDKVNLPLFFKIDLEEKTAKSIKEGGEGRTSAIKSIMNADGVIVLQGMEMGMGWSLVLHESDGTMTLTSSKGDTGYVIFGACTSCLEGEE